MTRWRQQRTPQKHELYALLIKTHTFTFPQFTHSFAHTHKLLALPISVSENKRQNGTKDHQRVIIWFWSIDLLLVIQFFALDVCEN